MKWKVIGSAALTVVLSYALLQIDWAGQGDTKAITAAIPAPDHRVAAGGLVEPASEARELSATVVGRLTKVNFDEGDSVLANEVIAEIENEDLKAQLAAEEAELSARDSELLRLKTGARKQEISAAKAELREAEAAAAVARSNYDRQAALAEKQIVSKETVERARADRDTSDARREFVAQRLALLVAPPRSEDLAIAQSNLAAARAHLAEVGAQLEKTFIRSPIDGVVLKLYRRTGESVTNLPPTPVVVVGDTRQLRVRADIDETDVAQMVIGQSVWVTADAYPGKRFKGIVAQIGMQLGRKNFRNNAPEERLDTKILEVMVDLEPGLSLPIGLPVDIKAENMTSRTKLSDAVIPKLRENGIALKQSLSQ